VTTSLAIVIVNFNTREHLERCLGSLVANEARPSPVVTVVDNGSSDGSIEMVRTRFPSVRLLVQSHNGGYGAAANVGIRSCDHDYILLLNSDTWVPATTPETLRTYLDEYPTAAIVGPALLNPDGSPQPSCRRFPHPLLPLAHWPWHDVAPVDRGPAVVPWVVGAALAIRRKAFDDVGGFDESFFMYLEETDLCYRLGQRGWETHFTRRATVVHTGGASTRQYGTPMMVQLFRSSVAFHQHHHSSVMAATAAGLLRLAMAARLVRDVPRAWVASDPRQRAITRQNIQAWWQVLRSPAAPGRSIPHL
jgi:N-acetylglucosaminyl-diphospho-decaprenol L-rhamnosyltransferase